MGSGLDAKFELERAGRKTATEFLYRFFQDHILNSNELKSRRITPVMKDFNVYISESSSGKILKISHGPFGELSIILLNESGSVLTEQNIGQPTVENYHMLSDRLLVSIVAVLQA